MAGDISERAQTSPGPIPLLTQVDTHPRAPYCRRREDSIKTLTQICSSCREKERSDELESLGPGRATLPSAGRTRPPRSERHHIADEARTSRRTA